MYMYATPRHNPHGVSYVGEHCNYQLLKYWHHVAKMLVLLDNFLNNVQAPIQHRGIAVRPFQQH